MSQFAGLVSYSYPMNLGIEPEYAMIGKSAAMPKAEVIATHSHPGSFPFPNPKSSRFLS